MIVGSGSSSTVVKVPAATAIADVAAARRDYLDETGGRYVHVLADVPIWDADSIALAIACGADAVMLGRNLAQASEAAANGVYWEAQAAHPRFPRGDVSKDPVVSTATALETVLFGPSSVPYGGLNIVGGLKRMMAKCGYTDIKAFQKADLAIRD